MREGREKRKGHDRDGVEQGTTVGALSHDTAMRQMVLTMRLLAFFQ